MPTCKHGLNFFSKNSDLFAGLDDRCGLPMSLHRKNIIAQWTCSMLFTKVTIVNFLCSSDILAVKHSIIVIMMI